LAYVFPEIEDFTRKGSFTEKELSMIQKIVVNLGFSNISRLSTPTNVPTYLASPHPRCNPDVFSSGMFLMRNIMECK